MFKSNLPYHTLLAQQEEQQASTLTVIGSIPIECTIDSTFFWHLNPYKYDVLMIKQCTKCNLHKDISEFSKKWTRVDWTIKYSPECKPCHRIIANAYYQNDKDWYKARSNKNRKANIVKYRKQFLDYLNTQQCFDCWIKDIRLLEFDHIKDKNFNIASKTRTTPINSLLPEIQKCEVVCANCHRIRTYTRCNSHRISYARVV